jgi:hypothetical protein
MDQADSHLTEYLGAQLIHQVSRGFKMRHHLARSAARPGARSRGPWGGVAAEWKSC